MSRSSSNQNNLLAVGLAAAALASLVLWYAYQQQESFDDDDTKKPLKDPQKSSSSSTRNVSSSGGPRTPSITKPQTDHQAQTPLVNNTTTTAVRDEKALHLQIEELDKRGKAFFKNKQYLEAAQAFTDALELIGDSTKGSSSLLRQAITLTNNRSAMYEKAGLADLALVDCSTVLEKEVGHVKARTRKLRILESQGNFREALVEMCAMELKFMQDHREQLRMGIPVTPPVPHSKLEEYLSKLLPSEVESHLQKQVGNISRRLPSNHTILQLLLSFSGYNAWMAQAARDGTVELLTKQLEDATTTAQKAHVLLKRGQRYAYERQYDSARNDFELAYGLVDEGEGNDPAIVLEGDDYARLLEWTGMVKHWQYDLEGAARCYERCSDLEPTNTTVLVKRAGVKMDGGKFEEAMTLFHTAIALDTSSTDAWLHRANLYMLQQKVPEALSDLQRCLQLRPDHIMARLRLATVYMATNDLEGAQKALQAAAQIDPYSSEVHSYRGEMHFAQGEFAEAREEFDMAIKIDPTNPTPYVNAALAVMNIPSGPGGLPDAPEAIRLLEKALEVDPQFHAAYVHLGQLRLSMATDLAVAREVVKLYDKGLEYCRTPEELKDICGMRILTLAQVEAATLLKMETFSMQ